MSTTDISLKRFHKAIGSGIKRQKSIATPTQVRITERKLIGIRDLLIDLWLERVQTLALQLSIGALTIQEWVLSMRREVFSVFADEYMLAKGGWNAMYPADIDALTLILNEQYATYKVSQATFLTARSVNHKYQHDPNCIWDRRPKHMSAAKRDDIT